MYHVYNWLQIRGENKDQAKEKTENILHKLEIYEAKDTPAMNLSGGMKQKVLLAMSMAIDTQLLFLDEPTIGLDPISRRQVWSVYQGLEKGWPVDPFDNPLHGWSLRCFQIIL